ncbi:sigma-70 family RNA polymerase sigma factor [Virgibacillus sp. DJP39]|uniref:sigma-70 family RNA polymerase sigma factor n=1 Tax=Virgibacillus sp. DJP39 TaxID=3409790 RepID=UPI003BB4E2F0
MNLSESSKPPSKGHEIQLLHNNPKHTIESIMDTYGDEIKRLVYTYLKNSADTDDVTQEVFVAIYQKLHTYQGNASLRSWIYSIAINKSKDHLRSWQSRNKRLKEKLVQKVATLPKSGSNPEDLFERQAETTTLLNQIMDMPTKYSEVIILYYFKELTSKEISHALGINEATVRTRLNRGRGKLKQLLTTERGVYLG